MNEHLIWVNPLAPRWRFGLIAAMVAVVIAILAAMATQALNTWIGIALMLAVAVVINLIHRIGTFLMIDEQGLNFGGYPRPQDTVPLSQVKSVRVEELPAHQRIRKPWGSLVDPQHPNTTVVDANQSRRAVVLALRDGRTVKIGVGTNGPGAEDFVANLRRQRRGIRG